MRRRSLPLSWFVVASGCCSLLLGQKAELAHRCMTARRRVRRLFVIASRGGACRNINGSLLQAVFGEVRRCFSSLLASLHQSDSSLSCKRKLVVASRERQLLLRQEGVHRRIRKPITVVGSLREETIRWESVHRQAASPKEVDAAVTGIRHLMVASQQDSSLVIAAHRRIMAARGWSSREERQVVFTSGDRSSSEAARSSSYQGTARKKNPGCRHVH